MNIVTGYTGSPHITSSQDRAGNQGAIGTGSYILNIGEKLDPMIVSANEVRLKDGAVCHQGCIGVIDSGSYDSVSIANGSQGMKRKDLIVCRYTKNSGTNVENLEIVCIQGTATSGTPSLPSYNSGNIQEGDSPVDMPLFAVNIDGTSITSVEQLASNVMTQAETDALLGNTSLPTASPTVTGAIGETYRRTRLSYGKGTHTLGRLYGITGFISTGGTVNINIPINLASNVTNVSFTSLVASIRNTAGSYIYSTSADMASLITSASIGDKQPVIRVILNSNDFVGTNNTPVTGEITSGTMVLS